MVATTTPGQRQHQTARQRDEPIRIVDFQRDYSRFCGVIQVAVHRLHLEGVAPPEQAAVLHPVLARQLPLLLVTAQSVCVDPLLRMDGRAPTVEFENDKTLGRSYAELRD